MCSSSAKDNLQCKLTAVIRRQPCSMRCSVAVSCCMVWRSLLVRFSYSYIVVALAQFPGGIIFEETLVCSGHVMLAFRASVFEIGQICTMAQLLLEFQFSVSSVGLPLLLIRVRQHSCNDRVRIILSIVKPFQQGGVPLHELFQHGVYLFSLEFHFTTSSQGCI